MEISIYNGKDKDTLVKIMVKSFYFKKVDNLCRQLNIYNLHGTEELLYYFILFYFTAEILLFVLKKCTLAFVVS